MDPGRLALVRSVLKYCGGEKRVMDLFSDRSISSRFVSLAKQHIKVGQKGKAPEEGRGVCVCVKREMG